MRFTSDRCSGLTPAIQARTPAAPSASLALASRVGADMDPDEREPFRSSEAFAIRSRFTVIPPCGRPFDLEPLNDTVHLPRRLVRRLQFLQDLLAALLMLLLGNKVLPPQFIEFREPLLD